MAHSTPGKNWRIRAFVKRAVYDLLISGRICELLKFAKECVIECVKHVRGVGYKKCKMSVTFCFVIRLDQYT
jgi:hypothetical protein